jgi:hypothetical protein
LLPFQKAQSAPNSSIKKNNKFIVVSKLSAPSTTFGANSVKLIEMRTSQQSTMLFFNGGSSRLIVEYIFSSGSEGSHTACRFIVELDATAKDVRAVCLPTLTSVPTPHFEGAGAQSGHQEDSERVQAAQSHSIQMIVDSVSENNSKIFLILQNNHTIFCEGEWEHSAFGQNFASGMASGHNMASGPAYGQNVASGGTSGQNMASGSAFGHNFASGAASGQNLAFGLIMAFSCNLAVGLFSFSLYASEALQLVAFVDLCISFIGGFNGFVGLVSIVGNDGLSNQNDLVGFICLGVSSIGLVGHNGHISLIGLSFVSSAHWHVSFIGLGGHNGNISLIGLGFVSSARWLIGFIGLGLDGFIDLVLDSHVSISGLISHNFLDDVIGLGLVSLVGLVSLSDINGLVGLNNLVAAIIAAAEFLVATATQAAAAKTHGVAIKLASATKITNAEIWYYCAALLLSLIWRESGLWCEWRVFSSLAGLNSVFENALQNAKQLFHMSLLQMTKYCIMRECENILCGYLYDGDLAFVILKGISSFKFPKRFWRSLPEISLSLFTLLLN